MHVGAAESVDRLFGVAHRDQVASECSFKDPPLERVGVLEFVDQHQVVAVVQPGDHGRPIDRIGNGIV